MNSIADDVKRLRELLAKATTPNDFSWYFPWRVVPSDGKPIIVGAKSGNLFRGYIATWSEADLIVETINSLPRLLDALEPTVPSEDVVERVARAICASKDLNPDCLYQHNFEGDWPEDSRSEYADHITGKARVMLFHKAWRHSEKAARAALASMSSQGVERAAEEWAADNYLAEYVMSTEGADYEPTPWERELIADALYGWLAERENLLRDQVASPPKDSQ